MLFFNPVAMKIIAVGIEPSLGALGRRTNLGYNFPESRRVVHLDEMRNLMCRKIIQHIRRRENQPP